MKREDINTLDDFAKYLNEYYAAPEHKEDGTEIIEELDALGNDEAIFTDHDSETPTEWEKVNIHPTEWEYDTHHHCVAVC